MNVTPQLTLRQSRLLDEIIAGKRFLHAADVRVARALHALGLVKLEDYGEMKKANGRSDRERWWCVPL